MTKVSLRRCLEGIARAVAAFFRCSLEWSRSYSHLKRVYPAMSVLLDKMVVKSIRCCLGLVVSSGRIGPTDQPCGGYHSRLGSTRDQARWRLSYPLAQWMYRAWLILELWFDNAQLDVGLSIFPLARSLLPKWAFQALAMVVVGGRE